MLRNFAPAVLFVDEFDALGAARGAAAAGDESASIINELLVQVRVSPSLASMTVLRVALRLLAVQGWLSSESCWCRRVCVTCAAGCCFRTFGLCLSHACKWPVTRPLLCTAAAPAYLRVNAT
eukprot:GHRQ01030786.1.p1 GENE.GHRQ01030786.1~~GHRQ01030786.1.p1  ORF type:complete len:122 (-),score=31.57 GHRQ01030786.1:107-472(-)